MTSRQRAPLCRQVEFLDDLVAVATPERQDLAVAEAADHGDAGVRGAPPRRRDEAQEADDGAVDLVRGLDLGVEAVPQVLDLLEPAADPAVALVAGALVEQAEHRLGLDVGVDLGEHALQVAGRPGRVETPDRVDFPLSHAGLSLAPDRRAETSSRRGVRPGAGARPVRLMTFPAPEPPPSGKRLPV